MNKTELFKYVKNVGYPFWELALVNGFKATRIKIYKCEDVAGDATPEEKLNASLNALEIALSTFPETQKFAITLKNSETANGSGICGPVEFINQKGDTTQQPSGAAGLGSLPGLPDQTKLRALGYVSESEMRAALEAQRVENQRALLDLEYKIKEDNLKRDYQRKQKQLRDSIEEYRRAKDEAQSGVNKFVNAIQLAGPPILSKLLGIDLNALSGPQGNEQGQEIEVKDAKYIEIEKLATELYDSPASLEDVANLRNNLKLNNYEFHTDEEE